MSYNYLPIPPRVWSRVQNPCTFINPDDNYTQAYIPLTNQTVSQAQADYQEKLLYKGNILQYKNNSSRLTKKQKYTQLAKGLGPNRTKVFATQSETYTNPNTTGLLRVNSQKFPFPNQLVGEPNNISGPFQYNVPNPNGCPPDINDCSGNCLEDGGNLVCGTYINQCTGEIIKASDPQVLQCYPTYCSDVPGTPQLLCWSSKLNTWFPRQSLTMNNSGNKFPQGYKGFVSALKSDAPVLSGSVDDLTVYLSWTYRETSCLPITGFNLYNKDSLIATLSSTTYNFTTSITACLYYIFSVIPIINSSSNNLGTRSNYFEILPINNIPPTNLVATLDSICIADTIDLSWNLPTTSCSGSVFNIYGYTIDSSKPILYGTVSNTTTTYTVTNLIANTAYTFYVTSYVDGVDSLTSNTTSCSTQPIITTTISTGNYNIITKKIGNKINYQIIFDASGDFTINSCAALDPSSSIIAILIGGGGGGGGGGGDFNVGGSGGGGGAETLQITINSVTMSTSYNINLGTGGKGGTQNTSFGTPGVQGNSSIFTYNSTPYTANPGLGAQNSSGNKKGGIGGNGGSSGINGGDGGINQSIGKTGITIPNSNYKSIGGGGGGGGGDILTSSFIPYVFAGGGGGGGVGYDISLNRIITGTIIDPLTGNTVTGGTGGFPGGGGTGIPGFMYGGNGGKPTNPGTNGIYGGGGGGGGVNVNTYDPGYGGKGGDGLCVVTISYVIKI